MKTTIFSHDTRLSTPSVATLGFFDGVHLGHRHLISQVLTLSGQQGMESMVVTFRNHPREALHSDYQPQLLTTYDEKMVLLSKTGIDHCVVIDFNEQWAAMAARDFMADILSERLGVKTLVMGYDHHFGRGGQDSPDDFRRYGEETGIEVIRATPLEMDGCNVSSSLVRRELKMGCVSRAASFLGYPFTIMGVVVRGYGEGRRIGFPTANIRLTDTRQMVPASGVYAVRVRLANDVHFFNGMMNIGTRPTYDGHETTLEVHLFNYLGNLYGETLLVSFVERIRDEQRFSSPEELADQLHSDADKVAEVLKL
ncbi:MAG: riboflavin biosynthesis protein RibF [Prevotella sp.]|nr:riboflavin biosynthesis protein RibF [Prevotella sp.]